MLTAGSTVAIAGCGSDESTNDEEAEDDNTDQPGVNDTDDEEDVGPDPRGPDTVLFVPANEEYVFEVREQYDAVEIEPTGAVLFEPQSSLTLNNLMNT